MRKCVDKRDKATSRRGIQEGGFPWLLWWAGRDTQIPGPPLTIHIDHTVLQEHTAHPSDMSTVCTCGGGGGGGRDKVMHNIDSCTCQVPPRKSGMCSGGMWSDNAPVSCKNKHQLAGGSTIHSRAWTLFHTDHGYCGCPQEGGEGRVIRPLWQTVDQQQ